ncbi:MAG TPA: ABC transporter substrate-binding protein [Candidatus Binatia bacterium]|jgi:4,5-dihydroxyphthalate decarboxylase
MAKLQLSFVSAPNERVEPLINGTIPIEGAELITTYSDPSETFWRQLKFQEFEISEMSLSSYLIAKSQGMDMIALPVFPSRRFMHAQLSYHVDSGIKEPGDIVGKRIGVGEYQQTASLWVRGVLEHDFGVSQYKVHWYMERSEELSHGGATGFAPPPGISFQRIPQDQSLASMLVANEIDVASVHRAFSRESNIVDRSTQIRARGGDWSKVKPLFADMIGEGTRFFKKHGYIPANHAYIIRGDIDRKYPWLAFNLYKAFVAAKQWAQERLKENIPSGLIFRDEYYAKTREIFGDDPFPYGVKANRNMLQTIIDYSFEQGLTKKKLKFEELFAPSTLEL